MSDFFSRWHALITPVAPTGAFPHVETGDAVTRVLSVDGKTMPYHMLHGWIALATVCHLPAVVIPVPRRPGQLPCGVQIIGPEGRDEDVLAIAEAIEAQMGGFQRPPEDALKALPTMVRPKPKPAPRPAKQVKAKPAKPAKVVKAKPAPKSKPAKK
jgi:hypothetical protein